MCRGRGDERSKGDKDYQKHIVDPCARRETLDIGLTNTIVMG